MDKRHISREICRIKGVFFGDAICEVISQCMIKSLHHT